MNELRIELESGYSKADINNIPAIPSDTICAFISKYPKSKSAIAKG